MALSNTAVPKYYGMFRDAVIRGEIPVNEQISTGRDRASDFLSTVGDLLAIGASAATIAAAVYTIRK
jgi:hypothetical protein